MALSNEEVYGLTKENVRDMRTWNKKNYSLFASKQIVSSAILDDSADGTIASIKIVGKAEKVGNTLKLGEGEVVSSNKNRFDKTKVENGYLGADGQKASSSETYRISDYMNVDDTSNVTISGNAGVSEINCFYDSSKNFISAFNMREDKTKTVDVPSNAKYIRSTIKATNIDTYQIEVGTSATDYVVGKTSSINAHSILNNYLLSVNNVKDELNVLGNGTGYLEKRCGLNSDETEVIVLDNPQTIPLTPTQVQQLLALETFKAHTDIVTDCEIELGYYKDNENGQALADVDSKVNERISEVEGNLQISEDNFDGFNVYKIGKLVTLTKIGNIAFVGTDGIQIGTVPVGFRPSKIVTWTTYCYNGTTYVECALRIDNITGAIRLTNFFNNKIDNLVPNNIQLTSISYRTEK